MTIRLADPLDVLDWPDSGITMSRVQSEKLGTDGIDLPHGEPRVFDPAEALMHDLRTVPYSVLLQRMEFYHRGRHDPQRPSLEASE